MSKALKLLAVFPHPDDETLGLGSTMARYAAEGVETYLVCATRGERGWFESEGPDPGREKLGEIRTEELNQAAGHLGIRDVSFLNYIDGDVDQAHPIEIVNKVVAHIRRIKPQVVVTFGPDGIYGHPDHIALSQFTSAAIVCAADASHVDADHQAPHRVSKLYYMVDALEAVNRANAAFGGISMQVDGVVRQHTGWSDWQITTRLDNRAYMDKVQKAIRCHKTQLPGYGPLADWSVDELKNVFGVGTFYRAFSQVNGGRHTETDFFEGLR